jgi:Mn2+/Fe2+ NRAMP family transporter
MPSTPDHTRSGPQGRDERSRRDSAKRAGRRSISRIGRTRLFVFLAALGPGMIAALADNDAGAITTWSVVGSRYGFSMLWLLVLVTPVLAILQEMNARIGAATGRGMAALIRENFALKVTAFAILATTLANFGTAVSEFSGVSAACGLLGVPSFIGVPVVAVAVWLLVVRGSYRRVERVFLALGLVYVTYIVSALLAHPDWKAAAHGAVIPHMSTDTGWLFLAIAAIGTTITPWGQFFIQASVVDKRISMKNFRYTRLEVYLGALVTVGIDFFIVLACATVLHPEGVWVKSAEDAARALEPFVGHAAELLFGIGLLNVSILASGILPLATAYVVCEAFGFESGLDHSFSEAPIFNGILTVFIAVPALVAMIPGLPLVAVIMVAQTLNGILLPIVLIFALKMVNDPAVMGEYTNTTPRNIVSWVFTFALIALSVALLLSPFVG